MKTRINDTSGLTQIPFSNPTTDTEDSEPTGFQCDSQATFNSGSTVAGAFIANGGGKFASGSVRSSSFTVSAYNTLCVVSGASAHVTATLPASPTQWESHTFIDASAAAATYNIVIVSRDNVNHPIVGHDTDARGIKLGKAGGAATVVYAAPFWLPTAISGAI